MIFDLTVSGGTRGKEAIQKIRDVDTDIPVFVSSGYADDPVMARPRECGFNASLAKPFRIAALSRLLSEDLGKA